VTAGRVSGVVSIVACCGLVWLVSRDVAGPAVVKGDASARAQEEVERLGELLETRRAVATGEVRVTELGASRHDVAAIWESQAFLQAGRLEEAWAVLERFPLDCDRPMVQLLRARIAAGARQPVVSSRAYERAIRLGPARDALWLESAEWMKAGGLEERAVARLERLPDIGSRDRRVYYALSTLALGKRKTAEAASLMSTAWKLEPIPRAEILASPAVSALLGIDEVAELVSISAPREPKFRVAGETPFAVRFPAESDATVTGSLLVVTIGESELVVPGGSQLAPETGARLLDAVEREEMETARRLDDFDALVESSPSVTLAQPSLRERFTRTAEALAERGRWNDVERLTNQLLPEDDGVPMDLLLLRGVALFKLGRLDDARRYAGGIAAGRVARLGVGPEGAYQLGELFAALELYDPAIRMLERADAMMENVSLDDRIRQLSMNRRLAAAYSVHESRNFIFHYPPDVSAAQIKALAGVMEAELTRLRRTIPAESFRQTTVNVVWWGEFRSTYTFSDHVLGFYDGRITLPLAGVDVHDPDVVAVVTHELAHALIAQATNDRAPAWLHEGLAQRVEMVPRQPSAFGMYTEDRMLPIALIGPVLRHSIDPERLYQAYVTSQTLVRFIESAYGDRAIGDLVRRIRDGGEAEAALRSVTGADEVELEIAFREWGKARTHGFENAVIHRYGEEASRAPRGGSAKWSRGGRP
jgi:tetratricopeptide (TPR) repeat protein